ncbi:MAG TPA: PEGA domain-containing protein [Candidatus Binatus sp.]|jgi:serine/threonine protein kinase|nr:PEGA domain-containing protein [Candidatus Binatus sp.]
MPTKIGHFEILSELAKSPTGVVYKANDPASGQTIALKTIQLSAFGESAAALEQALLTEAESTKVLSSPNITNVSGASVIDGQLCAAMEYIQGNSIATMLARKEGFSIWDLLDIGRQLSAALDHAKSHNIVHYSLEPSKIMCGWDGTVRILSYGVSAVGNFVQHSPEAVPSILLYMSPEQVRGEAVDGRSNLFSLGAILYEMVTERRAFDGQDAESVRRSILESTPAPPLHVNAKVHPLLSDLIMKALAKDPAQRFQHGRELLDDLEKCKESRPAAATKPAAAKSPTAPIKPNPAAQAKFVGATAPAVPAASGLARPSSPMPSAEAKAKLARPAEQKLATPAAKPVSRLAVPKAAAAAAGVGGDAKLSPSSPEVELDATQTPSASMSSAVADEPEVETFEPQVETFEPQVAEDGPKIAIDPMMAEGGAKASSGVSFSEMTELPPLKEVYIPPPPPPVEPVASSAPTPTFTRNQGTRKQDDKPKIQPREVAEKAIKEIKSVPPKLMVYAIGGAVALILVIGIAVTIYVHTLNSDDEPGAGQPAVVADTPAQNSQPAPKQAPEPVQSAPVQPTQPVETQPAETSEPDTAVSQPAPNARGRNGRKSKSAPALVITGGLSIDSTPQGAQVQVDGVTDPGYVTPFALTNMQPGQHSIRVSKPGYSTDTRTVNVTSANRASTIIHLTQLTATLVVKSDPAGASIYVDGRDVGTRTPAQVSVDKGQHVVLVRMPGYIDETMNAQFALGQTFNFSPTLRSLGNTENIKTVGGKMSKLFGGKGAQAGQGIVSIRTQPKGAQIAINQHMLDKGSPVDVALDPGNYVVDITLSGYAPVRKVITADRGGKVVVDEVMQPQ